jgi:hypothetical protein
MAYDRSAATGYADSFWNQPCDDGKVWLTNGAIDIAEQRRLKRTPEGDGWQARFVDDGSGAEMLAFVKAAPPETKKVQGWAGLADCAHFVSKCLQKGGINIFDLGVPSLVAKLQARADTKTLAEKVPRAAGQKVVDSGLLKPGDLIGYFNVSPDGDYGGAKEYSHSTIFHGKLNSSDDGRVSCHTISRSGTGSSSNPAVTDAWWLHDGYTYTFIHFSSDDTPISPATRPILEGWWQVDWGGKTYYYAIAGQGHTRYTFSRPTSGKTQLSSAAAVNSAYFFQDTNKLIFVWRKTGTVERWTPDSDGSWIVSIDGFNGRASKLF